MNTRLLTVLVLGLSSLVASGCKTSALPTPAKTIAFSGQGSVPLSDAESGAKPKAQLISAELREVTFTLVYRTLTDRLNESKDKLHVASAAGSAEALPPSCSAEIRVTPHTRKPGMAQVALHLEEFDREPTMWQTLTGTAPPRRPDSEKRLELYLLDVPQEEIDQLINKLRKGHVFDHAEATGSEARISTEVGSGEERACRPIPTLDALIFRIRFEGYRGIVGRLNFCFDKNGKAQLVGQQGP
jgi:hypothetical protein